MKNKTLLEDVQASGYDNSHRTYIPAQHLKKPDCYLIFSPALKADGIYLCGPIITLRTGVRSQ
jgi:hypothetical protein